jgi:hypothetical protein
MFTTYSLITLVALALITFFFTNVGILFINLFYFQRIKAYEGKNIEPLGIFYLSKGKKMKN